MRLHEKKGVNPVTTFCPKCGKDANELLLIGAHDSIYHCRNCKINLIGMSLCPQCNTHGDFVRKVQEGERLPASQPCDACKELQRLCDEMVREGGVYFRCKKCGSEGAIKSDHPLSADVRKALNVPSGKCGVELDECPTCANPEAPSNVEDMNPGGEGT